MSQSELSMTPIASGVGAISLLVTAYLLASVIYSTLLHPLAGFPGPVHCAVSRIPFWIACLRGREVQWMHKLHLRYGPVVRYSPESLSFVDDEGGAVWKAIHGRQEGSGREYGKAKEWWMKPANGELSQTHPSHLNRRSRTNILKHC